MSKTVPTLCFPDKEKSCFACCPPIRPAGYEHLDYRNIIKRILRENTDNFDPGNTEIIPITGFSCWALGYVDSYCRLVGCLLHPARNNGLDLRYRVDYGEKCRRESCKEQSLFSLLEIDDRKYWLQLSHGMDSFTYSSRKTNPLFRIIQWGPLLLHLIAVAQGHSPMTRDSFFSAYPFFTTSLRPRANAYLINRLVSERGTRILADPAFQVRFERFSNRLFRAFANRNSIRPDAPFTHSLEMDKDFLDLLRLGAGITKIRPEEARALKWETDRAIVRFEFSPQMTLIKNGEKRA